MPAPAFMYPSISEPSVNVCNHLPGGYLQVEHPGQRSLQLSDLQPWHST